MKWFIYSGGKFIRWFKNNTEILNTPINPSKNDNLNVDTTIREANELIRKKVTSLMDSEVDFINSISKIDESSKDTNTSLSSISASVEEFDANMQYLVETSKIIDKNIQNDNSLIAEGENSICSINDEISLVADSIKSFKTNFNDFQNSIETIKSFSSQIIDISEQTNLLSLNASIEAARAGETGKGFSVVANEVKSLSSETKELSNSITANLKKITYSADDLSSNLLNILTKLESSINKVNNSLKIFSDIKKSNKNTGEKILDMNTSFNESAGAMNEITNSVVSISNKSLDNINLVKTLQEKESMKIDYFTDILSFLEQLDYLTSKDK